MLHRAIFRLLFSITKVISVLHQIGLCGENCSSAYILHNATLTKVLLGSPISTFAGRIFPAISLKRTSTNVNLNRYLINLLLANRISAKNQESIAFVQKTDIPTQPHCKFFLNITVFSVTSSDFTENNKVQRTEQSSR